MGYYSAASQNITMKVCTAVYLVLLNATGRVVPLKNRKYTVKCSIKDAFVVLDV